MDHLQKVPLRKALFFKGSRKLLHGSRKLLHGSRKLLLGSRKVLHGSRKLLHGSRNIKIIGGKGGNFIFPGKKEAFSRRHPSGINTCFCRRSQNIYDPTKLNEFRAKRKTFSQAQWR
jgi:hypothetical protein